MFKLILAVVIVSIFLHQPGRVFFRKEYGEYTEACWTFFNGAVQLSGILGLIYLS